MRRRKADPGALSALRSVAQVPITEWPPNAASRAREPLGAARARSRGAGSAHAALHIYDHHACHAAAAAYASGFESCAVVVTIDGLGDGAVGDGQPLSRRRLERVASTPARSSPGVFFEHVTHLLNMRELEDEGKVMALADYASPIADDGNPMLGLLTCATA